ncbi:hypothetical protein AHiyo8_50640 [Arthrobacter sp. Hiyo8]|nr:hypothetical protein AHiyo8_50640 [Arthrobacter sp. Hiyo8]
MQGAGKAERLNGEVQRTDEQHRVSQRHGHCPKDNAPDQANAAGARNSTTLPVLTASPTAFGNSVKPSKATART